MHIPKGFWSSVTYVTAWFNLSPLSDQSAQEVTVLGHGSHGSSELVVSNPSDSNVSPLGFPSWEPDTVDNDHSFKCEYPAMTGWKNCSTPENQGCWLRAENGTEYNINTDYEHYAPMGIQQNYTLVVSDMRYNGDGMYLEEGKLINGTFPGPYIQACWGDTLNIKVINNMTHNGTSIHWHGIRQLNTMHMDGVNGITQCPIAPGDSFTYTFRALQYGSSWYHSHYSAQYADGVQGPLTIHGPSSAAFDAAKLPTIMTDWGHNSAFQALHNDPATNKKYELKAPSILLNGTGNINRFTGQKMATAKIPDPYTLTFRPKKNTDLGRAKKYLLRLINTSFDTTFVVSIDNHQMTVVTADFVPIHSYTNTSVLVGIGQRYHVIVEADPVEGIFLNGSTYNPIPNDGNFWIRTWIADGCGTLPRKTPGDKSTPVVEGYEKSGILRYNSSSEALPESKPWRGVSTLCSDETYSSLKPILKWKVASPINDDIRSEAPKTGEWFDINLLTPAKDQGSYPMGVFSMDPHQEGNPFYPFRVDYNNPMFLNLSYTGKWAKDQVVVPENFGEDDWVYMTILGGQGGQRRITSAHPIHLHGHDFALLQQSNVPFNGTEWKPEHMKLDNPPRRDVVLVPKEGFVIIAFKADNPGNWLMHCHIARHASEGLSLQILERQADAYKMWPENNRESVAAQRLCANWNLWVSNCQNWWHGNEKSKKCDKNKPWLPASGYIFQDDSGI